MEVVEIDIQRIHTEKYALRGDVGAAASKLKRSIEKLGLLQPATVQQRDDDSYDLVAGHARFETLKQLGQVTIPAVVIPAGEDALRRALAENFCREDLKPLEKARALRRLEDSGMNRKEIATLLKVSLPQVSNLLRMYGLEPELQQAIEKGKLHFGHAKGLLTLKGNRELQLEALKLIEARTAAKKSNTARDVEQLARNIKRRANGPAPPVEPELPTNVSLKEDSGDLVIEISDTSDLKNTLKQLIALISRGATFHVKTSAAPKQSGLETPVEVRS